MSEYLFRLEVPADKRSFTVAEALHATSSALHPDSGAEGPVMILSIKKIEHRPLLKDLAGRPEWLTPEDWQLLRAIWAGMDDPKFPMPLEQWQPYIDAFDSSPQKPEGWILSVSEHDPVLKTGLSRGIAYAEHEDALKRAVTSGTVTLRNPLTGAPSQLEWVGNAESWLLTRAHMKAFCDLLAIELTVPAAQLLTWGYVTEELRSTPGHRAALLLEYMRAIEAHAGDDVPSAITIGGRSFQISSDLMQRLDLLPGVDAALLDLTNPKLQAPGSLSREPGETAQPTETPELDSPSHSSAGRGMPNPEQAPLPAPAVQIAATQTPTLDRGRRLKRGALIADNVRRWPTIERDLKDAAVNGLSEAAKDGSAVGWWWEGSAIEWAQARAKVQAVAAGVGGVTSRIHRMQG